MKINYNVWGLNDEMPAQMEIAFTLIEAVADEHLSSDLCNACEFLAGEQSKLY